MTINIPDNVELSVNDRTVLVKGSQGTLSADLPKNIVINNDGKVVNLDRTSEGKATKANHGMIRAVIANMIKGVSENWEKQLELIGTGYRARMEGNKLHLSIGYSHPVLIDPPQGITFSVEGQNLVTVKGYDKQQVGLTAAKVRAVRPPEPYKGKGIRYVGEHVRRKAGKAAKA